MKNNTTEKRTVANPWEEGQLEAFADSLRQGERSLSTRRQYGREVRRFREWMRGRALDKEAVISYKEILEKTGQRQHQAGRHQQLSGLPGEAGVEGQAAADPAERLLLRGAGAEPAGVSAAGDGRPPEGG